MKSSGHRMVKRVSSVSHHIHIFPSLSNLASKNKLNMSNQNKIVIHVQLKHYSTCCVVDQSKERQNPTLKQTHVIYCVKFFDGGCSITIYKRRLSEWLFSIGEDACNLISSPCT